MRGIIAFIILLLSISLYSQVDSTSTGDVVDAEIVIEKDRQIRLPVATKINSRAINRNLEISPLNINYKAVDPEFKWPEYKSEVSYEESNEKLHSLFQNSFKVGFGNFSSPLLEVKYFENLNNLKLSSRFFHESFLFEMPPCN